MKPISPDERAYLDSLPARTRRKRVKPKPGRPEDPQREKCVCFLSTCVTESEMDAFERLRLREPFPPSRSTFNRFLIKEAVQRFRDGFPDTFVAAWLSAGLPPWWGPEAASVAPVTIPRGHAGSSAGCEAPGGRAAGADAALSCLITKQNSQTC